MTKFQPKNWNQIAALLLLSFALGAVAGQWYTKENFRKHWKKGDIRQNVLDRFSQKLGLNEEQKRKAAAIFDAKQPKMAALHAEVKPKFDVLRKEAQAEIRAILNPEQQKKFDEMTAQKEKRREERAKYFNL